MTKIKNTKKGMAKKTLSMSLVVAMLATSNVPVWAAEFSDGTDAAVTSEVTAPVVEDTATDEFTDNAAVTSETEAPVVDDASVVDTATADTAEKKLCFDTAEVGTPVQFADGSVLKNSEGKAVTVFDYEWLIDGVQAADANGNAIADASGKVTEGGTGISAADVIKKIKSFTPQANHLGGKLSLKITGVKGTNEDFEGFTYETPAITITEKDIKNVVESIALKSGKTLTYDGEAKTLSSDDVEVKLKSTVSANELTADDFTFTYNGDIVNASKTKDDIKVTATVNKPGYKGSYTFAITIGQKTLATFSDQNLTDKTANDLSVSLKNTQYKYTGEAIDLKANVEDNFTLKSNISGNTLSSKAITGVSPVEGTLKDAGDSTKVKVSITKTGDKELDRNYAPGAFDSGKGIGYTTAEKATVVARDLSTCTIDDISIGSVKAKKITKNEIKNLIKISEGKEDLNNATFMGNVDIEVDVDAVNKANDGTSFPVVVKAIDTTKNVIGRKTITLYVAQNDINEAALKSQAVQLNNNKVATDTELNEKTEFAPEYYQGGASVEKTADQLGTIIISGTNVALKEGTDYKVVYENNTNVGEAKVYLQGISATLAGKKCIGKFKIEPAVVAEDSITVPDTVAYDGSKTEASEYLKKSDIKVQAKTYTWAKKTVGTNVSFEKVSKLIDVPENLYDTEFAIDGRSTKIVDQTKLTTTVKEAKDVDKTSAAYKNYSVSGLAVVAKNRTTVSTLSIVNADVTVVGAPFVYTGKEITPDLVVKDGDRTLVKDVDYEVVSEVNNKNAGTAKITIKGKGDYSAAKTKTVEFTINKADLSKVTITPKKDKVAKEFTYTGEKLTPALANYDIKLGDETLTTDDIADIKITYPASSSANVNAGKEAGSATLTIKDTAKNPNFEGTNAFKFDIEQKVLASGGVFTLWKDGKVVTSAEASTNDSNVKNVLFTNDGTAHTFDKVTYTPKAGEKYKEGVDYEIKYYNNTRGPLAAIYVNALGNYKNADTKFDDKATTYTDAKFFRIEAVSIRKSDVQVSNTEYAGGIAVKPTVTVKANGAVLEDGIDYKIETEGDCANVTATDKVLKAKLYAKDGYVLDAKTWGTALKTDSNKKQYAELTWKVVAKDLKNTTATAYKDESGKVVVTVMNGSVAVPASEYDVKENEDGTVTVTAKSTSTNYTGTITTSIGKDDTAIGTPMISDVKVTGNKATVILSGEADGATGYDYVIATDRDCITNKNYDAVNKNQVKTETTFNYVGQGTYYAYCHAWKRVDGKKVFSGWSEAHPFVVTAITPAQPTITSVKASGSTVTVTYTKADYADGYDVVLGTASKKVNGEIRPVEYGKLVKKNVNKDTVTVTFKNVEKGTYVAGLHAYNRTSEDGKKVFSQWSNVKKVTVK